MKKRLRLLSEERLAPREEKPCGFVPPFLGKKNGGEGVTPETIVFFAYLASKVIDYQALIPVFL